MVKQQMVCISILTPLLAFIASKPAAAAIGYNVYRGGVLIATTAATTYSDAGLTPSTVYSYTVAAFDASGASAQSAPASTTTLPPAAPAITSALTASGTAGTAFSYQITASNSPASFNATGLPAGLSVNTVSGLVSGTPSAAGTSSVVISATNAGGTGSATLVLTVNGALAASVSSIPAVCAVISCPALVNPQDPTSSAYGAKNDGSADATAAFQAAVNAGDLFIPPGTYLINGTININVSSKHIQCAPGAVIKNTVNTVRDLFRFGFNQVPITGDSLIGCDFEGSNTVPAQYFQDAREWNIPVEAWFQTNNILLAGNTFNQFWGQSMFQTYASTVSQSGSGDVIEYNTFKNCGSYGPVFDSHTNGYVGHNFVQDCAVGVENDYAAGQATGGNVFEYNVVTTVYGAGGGPGMNDAEFLTGGGAAGADYSGNIVRYNSISGKSATTGLPSQLYEYSTGTRAQYTGNLCNGGCSCFYGCTDGTGPGAGAAPAITSAMTASGGVGAVFSYQISAANGPTSFNAVGLPSGLSINAATGLISGTPSVSGTFGVPVAAFNASGGGSAIVNVMIGTSPLPAPAITSALTASGTAGTAFSYQITASNSPASFNATGLPAGLSVNTVSGLVSGTPSAAGTSNVTISATNASGTGSATLALTVNPAAATGPVAAYSFSEGTGATTADNTGDGHTGSVVNATWTASGKFGDALSFNGSSAYVDVPASSAWSPSDLTLSADVNLVAYSTDMASVVNRWSQTVDDEYLFAITPAGQLTFAWQTTGSTSAWGTASYNIVTGTGKVALGAMTNVALVRSGASLSFYINGNLDATFSGAIDANPFRDGINSLRLGGQSRGGAARFLNGVIDEVRVYNRALSQAQIQSDMNTAIVPAKPAITSALSAVGTVGTAFSYQITAANSPTSFNAAGLPAGLSISSATGLISGMPSVAGTAGVMISAVNAGGTGTAMLSLTISNPTPPAPVITSGLSASGTTGSAFSYQIAATNSPASFNAAGLPAGLSVNTSNGLISGTPSAVGSSSVTISATNAGGTGSAVLSLAVNSAPPPAVSFLSPSDGATVSGTVVISVSASGALGITSVQMYLDGALTATDIVPPYNFSWNTAQVANGGHTLTAKAYDALGDSASAAISVNVHNKHIKASATFSSVTSITATTVMQAFASKSLQTLFTISVDTVGEPSFPLASSLQVNTTLPSAATEALTLTQLPSNPNVFYALISDTSGMQAFANGSTVTITVGNQTFDGAWLVNEMYPSLGGSVSEQAGGAGVMLLPNSFSQNAQLAINPPPPDPGSLRQNALKKQNLKSLDVGRDIVFSSSGTMNSATLIVPFDPTQIPAPLSAADVRIAYFNTRTNAWEMIDNVVAGQNMVQATVTHFSIYMPVLALPISASGLIGAYAFPNPAAPPNDPTIRACLGVVNDVGVTIFDVSGRIVNSATESQSPTSNIPSTGPCAGQYSYDYVWNGSKASGVYFAVVHGHAADGSVVKAKIKFAVVR